MTLTDKEKALIEQLVEKRNLLYLEISKINNVIYEIHDKKRVIRK